MNYRTAPTSFGELSNMVMMIKEVLVMTNGGDMDKREDELKLRSYLNI
ncbi:MAG: hypothetical protein HY295_05520 [Thaumarchaeota archaeon]|nr:hypothetical protein [Nitrososphaerota archaeon]